MALQELLKQQQPELPPTETTSPPNLESHGRLADGPSILAYHQYLANIYCTERPYWLYTHEDTQYPTSSLTQHTLSHLNLRYGTIRNFPRQAVAVMIDATLHSYLANGLFNGIPRDTETIDALTAAMIAGFDQHRLIVSVTDHQDQYSIGGCMVAPGQSQTLMSELIGSEHSSLPTAYALHFSPNGSTTIAQHLENQVACYTRFHRMIDMHLPPLLTTPAAIGQFSRATLAGMVLASQAYAQEQGVPLQYGLLDTHDPKVIKTLTKHYGGLVIDDSPTTTRQIAKEATPIGWHYEGVPGIVVIAFHHDQQLKQAQQVLKELLAC